MKYTVTDIWTTNYTRYDIEADDIDGAIFRRLREDVAPDHIDDCLLNLGWRIEPEDGEPTVFVSAFDNSRHPDVNGLCRVLGAQ